MDIEASEGDQDMIRTPKKKTQAKRKKPKGKKKDKKTAGSTPKPSTGTKNTELTEEQRKQGILKSAFSESARWAAYFIAVLIQRVYPVQDTTAARPGGLAAVTPTARQVLPNLVQDILSLLGLPEWPAAELFLVVLLNQLRGLLSDRSDSQTSKTSEHFPFSLLSSLSLVAW